MDNDEDQFALSEAKTKTTLPLLVGIGASAAFPEGIERFFSRFEKSSDIAVILVLQHREALDEKHLGRVLDGLHQDGLVPVENGLAIEGGRIYLCRADHITTIADGHFATRPAEQEPGERGTVDSFLVSLAEHRGEEAIGVVLAGTGGDGTLGVSALKDQGGLAIAERVANENHLADSNTAAGIADFLLPPDEIPDHIAVYVRHLMQRERRRGLEETLHAASGFLTRIADILRSRTGNDFHGYKPNTFFRRVQRRMQVTQIEEIGDYVELLRSDKDEAQNLFNDLLIGVTQFFRDGKEFDILANDVVPKIYADRDASQSVRVWVLGCATGEEAYSIGILLREHMATLEAPPSVQIFATDIDGRALAAARVGRFRADIVKDVSPERLARWFIKEGDTYCVVKELREMCIFSQHNVIKDAPFSKLDLVSCRNLLIYLNADLQSRVIPLFHFALLPDRFLFLGNSENVTRHPKLFAPIDRRARIFRKLENGVRLPPEFPLMAGSARRGTDPVAPRLRSHEAGMERRAQRIAERYSPAYVIVDEQLQVLHFSGRTGRYIEPTSGAATLDLLSLVHRDLRLELRMAFSRAFETNKAAHAEQVRLGVNGHSLAVDLTVEPAEDKGSNARTFIVVFREGPLRAEIGETAAEDGVVRDEQVERLESELRSTRERLHATIEELESTNEELKSSNEEYQSLNEELQSANEELETSREELQSVNEELTTVNSELAHRVQELTRATSDLKNFLESTQIATVFLNNDLQVMNFTPAVTEVMHLVETDVGRPITHIKARIAIDDILDDVRRVKRTLATVERETVESESGTRYIVRILPYRSIDNFIAGVVITFVDVTAITQAEERQRLLLAELQHRVRNTLGVVRSIARRTAETSETVEAFTMHFEGRLNAFARTQAIVTRDPEAGVDLEYIVSDEMNAYRMRDGEQVKISGPPISFNAKAAETLGLAIHELATNAMKYGALSAANGFVEVQWRVDDHDGQRQLVIDWEERNGPRIDEQPTRRGFGMELLDRTLAFELKAQTKISFEPGGLHCTITLPFGLRLLAKGSNRF